MQTRAAAAGQAQTKATADASRGTVLFGRQLERTSGELTAFGRRGITAFNGVAFAISQMAASGTADIRSLGSAITGMLAFFGTKGAVASIIGTAMDAMLMCDADRRIVLFNRSAEDMFGCPASVALTRTLDAFIPELQLEATRPEAAASGPAGGLRHRAEVDAVRTTGERVPIEVSVRMP